MKYWFSILLLLTSCTSLYPKQNVLHHVSKTFRANHAATWKAVVLALEDYPLKEQNQATGLILTNIIKGEKGWRPPFKTNYSKNVAYRMHIQVIKNESHPLLTTVHVTKQIFRHRGFIDGVQKIPSDGLEEQTLLYRIKREIVVEKMIARHMQKTVL